jgi:hypothetical protein
MSLLLLLGANAPAVPALVTLGESTDGTRTRPQRGFTRIDINDLLFVWFDFTVAGAYTDPAAVTVVVEDPDGIETTYTYTVNLSDVVRFAAGRYSIHVIPNKAGQWTVRVEGTGPASGVAERRFFVAASRFY